MSGQLRLFVLGTLEIFVDDRPIIAFNSNKTRALLIYLALNQKTHYRTTLAGLLWGEMPEDKAHTNLRKSIANLKKLVGDWLNITRQTVTFSSASNHWIDARAFLQTDDAEEAITLYRGDFLEGIFINDSLAFDQWLLQQRVQLRARMLTILQNGIEHQSNAGEFASATRYCQHLLSLEPWREETHAQLMLLYARLGQRTAALRQYKQCRTLLDAEFGVEPSPHTTSLMRRIRYAPTPKHNLPPELAPMLGRESLLHQLLNWGKDDRIRLITLVGAGGMGKTRMALAGGEALLPYFLEGVWFVDAVGIDNPSDLPAAIASAVNFKPNEMKPLKPQLLDFLREKELLLLIDNFEQLLAGRDLLTAIIRHAPQVKIVVTSREQLRLREEHVLRVDGLVDVDVAVQLFGRNAQQHHPAFDIKANYPAIKTICELVQGSPLAIELAAALAHHLPCDYIAQAIADNLDVLQTTMHDVPDRHRSVRAVFDYSWQALTPSEQDAFAQLSIFRGGFSLDAAQTICNITPQTLSHLVHKSLVRYEVTGRYACHQLLCQYAAEKLTAVETVVEKHRTYFLEMLQRDGNQLNGDGGLQALQRLQTDRLNIRMAWDGASQRLDTPVLTLCLPLIVHLYHRSGELEPQDHILTEIITRLQAVEDANDALLSVALLHHATVLTYRGAFDSAVASAQQAVALAEAIENQEILGKALIDLSGVYFRRGRYADMKQALTRLEALALPDGLVKVRWLNWRGVWHAKRRDSEAALRDYHASLALARTHGLRLEETITLLNIGISHDIQHDYANAERYLRQGLAIAKRIGFWRQEANAATYLSLVELRLNRPKQARARLEEVIAHYHRVGNQYRLGQPYTFLGIVTQSIEQFADSERYLKAGAKYYREQGQRDAVAIALAYLGQTLTVLGKFTEAETVLVEAQQLASATNYHYFEIKAVAARIELCLLTQSDASQLIEQYEAYPPMLADPMLHTWFLTAQAGWELKKGDVALAKQIAEEAVALSADFVPLYAVDALVRLGEIEVAHGETNAAEKTWQTILEMRTILQRPNGITQAKAQLDWLANEKSK